MLTSAAQHRGMAPAYTAVAVITVVIVVVIAAAWMLTFQTGAPI